MIERVSGFIAAFLFAALPGRWLIKRLQVLKAGQNINQDAPKSHAGKQGTPTMGGLLILVALTVTSFGCLIWPSKGASASSGVVSSLLPLLLLTLSFGAVGFADDYLSLKRGKNLGLRARDKFFIQVLLAAGFMTWMALTASEGITTEIQVLPNSLLNTFAAGKIVWNLGVLYYIIGGIMLIGFSNATNFTDGADGLASGSTCILAIVMALLLNLYHPDISLFCMLLAGGLLGFLWWNFHPARLFMGDTGSLALGAALAGSALLGKIEIPFIIASLAIWSELLSVMVQVTVFKFRKKKFGLEYARSHRVFRRTPLHHHFEEMGIPETQVVGRFWIVCVLCGAAALLWLQQGVL